jgi:hypothetical protein
LARSRASGWSNESPRSDPGRRSRSSISDRPTRRCGAPPTAIWQIRKAASAPTSSCESHTGLGLMPLLSRALVVPFLLGTSLGAPARGSSAFLRGRRLLCTPRSPHGASRTCEWAGER